MSYPSLGLWPSNGFPPPEHSNHNEKANILATWSKGASVAENQKHRVCRACPSFQDHLPQERGMNKAIQKNMPMEKQRS